MLASSSEAHQPVLSRREARKTLPLRPDVVGSMAIGDPTFASEAIYGRIAQTNQLDLYSFAPTKDVQIPIEVLVPVRKSNDDFRPAIVIFSASGPFLNVTTSPLFVLSGRSGILCIADRSDHRSVFVEPFGVERLYHGAQTLLTLTTGNTYYVGVFEPEHYLGDYSLALGTVENFSNVKMLTLIANVIRIKASLAGSDFLSWPDLLGFSLLAAAIGSGVFASLFGTMTVFRNLVCLAVASAGALIFYRVSKIGGLELQPYCWFRHCVKSHFPAL